MKKTRKMGLGLRLMWFPIYLLVHAGCSVLLSLIKCNSEILVQKLQYGIQAVLVFDILIN